MKAGGAGILVQLRPARGNPFPESRHRGWRRAVLLAPVRQGYRFGHATELQRPVQGRIAPAQYQQALAAETRGVLHPVMELPAFDRLGAVQAQFAGLKRAHASREKNSLRLESRARAGFNMETLPFSQRPQHGHFLAEMKGRFEGCDLLHEGVHQFLRVQNRYGRNIVDRLVRVELGALSARFPQGIDDMRIDAQQSQLKDLEQPAGTGANNQCIGLYGHGPQAGVRAGSTGAELYGWACAAIH